MNQAFYVLWTQCFDLILVEQLLHNGKSIYSDIDFLLNFYFLYVLISIFLIFTKVKILFIFFDRRFLFLTKSYDYLSFLTKHKAKF